MNPENYKLTPEILDEMHDYEFQKEWRMYERHYDFMENDDDSPYEKISKL